MNIRRFVDVTNVCQSCRKKARKAVVNGDIMFDIMFVLILNEVEDFTLTFVCSLSLQNFDRHRGLKSAFCATFVTIYLQL